MPCAAETSTNSDHIEENGGKHGHLLRDRLGRRSPRHRPGRPGRAAAGPPPDQRRRSRAGRSCWPCSPSTATPPMTRSRWRSRHPAGCWSRACAPPAGRSTPSTRWRWPATGTGTRSRAGNPTTATRSSWPTCCAPTSHVHRPLPADTELAQAIAVLARAQQDAVWDRTPAHNKLRSHLREYFPGFLAAFAAAKGGIMRPEARTILAAAPTPGRRREADPHPAARPAEESRPQPRPRHRSHPAARRVPRPADAPAPPRRAGHGPPGPGPARPARRRLRQRPTTSSRPPPSLLTSTRTPGSSPASQGSAH